MHDASMSKSAMKRGLAALLLAAALGVFPPSNARSADVLAGARETIRVRCTADADVTDALKGALTTAKARRGTVVLAADANGANCDLRESIYVHEGMNLIGEDSPVIKLAKSGTAFYGDDRSSNFLISQIAIDGSSAARSSAIRFSGSRDGRIEGVRLINPADGIALLEGTTGVLVKDFTCVGSRSHGITIKSSFGNRVEGAKLEDQAGFGVILSGHSYDNHLTRLQTTKSRLELVGMTYQTHDNTLTDSSAKGTGDNCYSITGSNNVLRNLNGEGCAGNGIAFYGSSNTLEGGTFKNNNQRFSVRSAWNGGIAFLQGFGGVAQHNKVSGVVVDDDQPARTQQVGVLVQKGGYRDWRPGTAVAAGTYAISGLDLYVARSSGVTGTERPTGSGTHFDGAVQWEHANSFSGTVQPDFNSAINVVVHRSAKEAREDRSQARSNIGTR